jgi:hypothetical protein
MKLPFVRRSEESGSHALCRADIEVDDRDVLDLTPYSERIDPNEIERFAAGIAAKMGRAPGPSDTDVKLAG